MNTLEKLRQRLGAIRDEANAITDAADAENEGVMTEEQTKQFDALMDEKEQVNASIERLEKLEDLNAGAGRVIPASAPKQPAQSAARIDLGIEKDPMRGFESYTEFGRAVRSACLQGGDVDDRLRILGAPTNFHRETQSSDGYMVPPAMRDEIWSLVFHGENLLSLVNPEPTESNAVTLSRDESTPWGSTGIQAAWGAEGGQLTKSRLETEGSTVKLHKLHAYVLASDELISDAPRLANRLTVGAARAIGWKADEAIVEGDGVGKPLGWISSGALVTVAKESGQSASTIVAANVLKMYSRLLMTDMQDAFWMINSNCIPQLAVMTIGDQPVYTPPSSGLRNAPGGFLLGLPVRFSEHCETLGTQGDIQLIAPRGYYAVNKTGGIDFKSSMHLFFDYDVEAFKWTFRLGGQPFLSAPVSPAKGSDTKSHFIRLATRA